MNICTLYSIIFYIKAKNENRRIFESLPNLIICSPQSLQKAEPGLGLLVQFRGYLSVAMFTSFLGLTAEHVLYLKSKYFRL